MTYPAATLPELQPEELAGFVSDGGAKLARELAALEAEEKADLVEEVKAMQRTDLSAKLAWWAYGDEYANGVKDPNRLDTESLSAFLSCEEARLPPQEPAWLPA